MANLHSSKVRYKVIHIVPRNENLVDLHSSKVRYKELY